MTPRRGDAPTTDGELRRRERTGKASDSEREPQGATRSRSTLARPGVGQPEPPEMGVLRPLARALVDLAIAVEDEDEEDERWTR